MRGGFCGLPSASGWGDLLDPFGLLFDCTVVGLFLQGFGYGVVPDIILWRCCESLYHADDGGRPSA